MPKVELIYDRDCPNVEATRNNLLRAFSHTKLRPHWQEWDRNSPDSPSHAKKFGSPTILVEGKDVAGETGGEANCCRIYASSDGNKGVPPVILISKALNPLTKSNSWKTSLAAVPGIGAVLLPKLTCPACWPAYAALSSSLGIGFFNYTGYLLPITTVAMAIALLALGYKASTRRGYGPLTLGFIAAIILFVGKFQVESEAVVYAAVAGFLIASVWNALPKRNCNSCKT